MKCDLNRYPVLKRAISELIKIFLTPAKKYKKNIFSLQKIQDSFLVSVLNHLVSSCLQGLLQGLWRIHVLGR